MNKICTIKIIVLLLFLIPLIVPGQSRRTDKQKEKYLERLKEDRRKEAEKQYQEAVKSHYKMQSKETRKMMKQTFKKSQREGKAKFFLKRWYDNIFNKRKMKERQQKNNPHLKAFVIPDLLNNYS
jgi:hypothetical protein